MCIMHAHRRVLVNVLLKLYFWINWLHVCWGGGVGVRLVMFVNIICTLQSMLIRKIRYTYSVQHVNCQLSNYANKAVDQPDSGTRASCKYARSVLRIACVPGFKHYAHVQTHTTHTHTHTLHGVVDTACASSQQHHQNIMLNVRHTHRIIIGTNTQIRL